MVMTMVNDGGGELKLCIISLSSFLYLGSEMLSVYSLAS